MTPSRIAVTGATGYIGSRLIARLRENGHSVVAMSRRPVAGVDWIAYELEAGLGAADLSGVSTVIHCAYDLRATKWNDIQRVNVDGTRRLIEAAASVGATTHLISSMSAYEGTRQLYGRAKLLSEAHIADADGVAIRLGLVFGAGGGGMFGSLERAARLPLLPSFGRGALQYMVHEQDMSTAIAALIESPLQLDGPIGLAHPRAVPFRSILEALAGNGRSARFVYVPWPLPYGGMKAAEMLRVHLPLRADSLLGLVRPASSVPQVDRWRELDVHLRHFLEAVAGEG